MLPAEGCKYLIMALDGGDQRQPVVLYDLFTTLGGARQARAVER